MKLRLLLTLLRLRYGVDGTGQVWLKFTHGETSRGEKARQESALYTRRGGAFWVGGA